MSTQKIEAILADGGSVQGGVWIVTQEDIIEDQKEWSASDASRSRDFTAAPYWIITDDGSGPFPVYDDSDLTGER